jgi:hypothetical protein
MIYNTMYTVPVWIVLSLDQAKEDEAAQYLAIREALVGADAYEQPWPSASFKDTVKKLGGRGWRHAVKELPYIIDSHFLPVAVADHVKSFFDDSKSLGQASRPWHQAIDRKISTEADYARIFNQVLAVEDPLSLSKLFDVGDKCYGDRTRYYVFFSDSTAPKNVLRAIAANVIVVGPGSDVDTRGRTTEEIVDDMNGQILPLIRGAIEQRKR